MLAWKIYFALLAIAVAGCQSEPINVGSGAGGNPVPISDGAAQDPNGCSDVQGVSYPAGQSFLCGFDSCNQCSCVDDRLTQNTFAACSTTVGGSDASSPVPSEGGIASDAEAQMPSSSCSDLLPAGFDVRIAFKSGAPPDLGKGGTIVDGTYNLIQSTIYQSTPTSQPFTERETIRISAGGTHLEYVTASDGFTIAESIAPMGASLNPTTLCPGPGVSVGPYYTATTDTFTVINGLYVKVFTRTATTDGGITAPCNTLAGGGPTISGQQSAGPPPDLGRGGTIIDGLYDLATFTYYNGTGGPGTFDSETIRVSGKGTKLEYVSNVYNFGMTISLAPNGTALNDRVVCPADQLDFNMFIGPYYTASAGQFIAIGQNYVKVFELRGTAPILIP